MTEVIIRGGSWYNFARSVRAAYRAWDYLDSRSSSGFRFALKKIN